MMPTNSPIMEHEREGDGYFDGYEQETSSADMCNCFGLFFRSSRNENKEQKRLLNQTGEQRQTWAAKNLKKLKETSEVLAGPKWKNFLRKLSGYGKNKKQKNNQFQYDPQSYALNFDYGADSDEDNSVRSFSTRYATPFLDDRNQNGL